MSCRCQKTPEYAPFEVELFPGRKLVYDGRGLTLEGAPLIPDGVYGLVVVQNGRVVDLKPAEAPGYTPGPCAGGLVDAGN